MIIFIWYYFYCCIVIILILCKFHISTSCWWHWWSIWYTVCWSICQCIVKLNICLFTTITQFIYFNRIIIFNTKWTSLICSLMFLWLKCIIFKLYYLCIICYSSNKCSNYLIRCTHRTIYPCFWCYIFYLNTSINFIWY